jgi:hypothetical protein
MIQTTCHRAARGIARVILPLLLAGPAAGQQAAAPLVLRLAGGTRALGFGNAYVAGRGPEVIFYNPAQISTAPGMALSVERFAGASSLGAFSATTALGSAFAAGFGLQYLDYGATPGVFPTGPGSLGTRGPLDAASLAATAALAVKWKGFRWGAAAEYLAERVPADRGDGAAISLGAARDFGRFTLGLAAEHLGGHLTVAGAQADLPSRVTAGAVLQRYAIGTYFDVSASAAVSRERDGRIAPAGGGELSYVPVEGWLFALRAGARRVEDGPTPHLLPFTLGATAALDRFALDYAFEAIRGGHAAHRIGVRIQ